MRQHTEGSSSVSVDGTTIGEVVAALVHRHPGISGQIVDSGGELHKFVNVYLNDDDVRYLGRLETEVSDGDVISVLPAVAGG